MMHTTGVLLHRERLSLNFDAHVTLLLLKIVVLLSAYLELSGKSLW